MFVRHVRMSCFWLICLFPQNIRSWTLDPSDYRLGLLRLLLFLFLFWETAPFRGCLANAGLVISLLLLVVGLCSSCITMAVCGNSSILRHTEDQKAEMGAYRQNGLILRF